MYKILAINPGSTSTKIAVYEDQERIIDISIDHPTEEIKQYNSINEQYGMRYERIVEALREKGLEINELDCIVGRGGPVAPVRSGAYEVDEALVDRIKNNPMIQHASSLGAMIAFEMSKAASIPAYIYDAVSTDEMQKIAKFSGIKGVERRSLVHTLNMRASGMKVAEKMDKKYDELNLVIAHLGGGLSCSVHEKGVMVDIAADDEGSFSPERAGILPTRAVMKLCYEKSEAEVSKLLVGGGGLASYLDTNDAREVEKMIDEGNEYAKEVYEAMAYQISKSIGELATVVDGKVDRVILTGGMAYSSMLTDWITKKVSFIAPVEVVPGENEMEALALGGLRVLKGEEKARKFQA